MTKEPDMRVLAGIAKDNSETLIRKELAAIMKKIKAEVQIDTEGMSKQLSQQLASISKNKRFSITLFPVKIDANAAKRLKVDTPDKNTSPLTPNPKTSNKKMQNLGKISNAISIASDVFSLFSFIIQQVNERTQKLVQTSIEAKSKFKEFSDQNRNNIKTLKSLSDEFDMLSKGVDDYGNNITLSADDYERYKEIVQQVVDISPELIEGYNKENEFIVNKNKLIEQTIELQEQEYRNELRKQTTIEGLRKRLDGPIAQYTDLSNDARYSKTNIQWSLRDLLNIDARKDIPQGMQEDEFFIKQVMKALDTDNIEEKARKYLDGNGIWHASDFMNDYLKIIVEDVQSRHSKLLSSIDYESSGFNNKDLFNIAVQKLKDNTSIYQSVQQDILQTEKEVDETIALIAKSSDKFGELGNVSQSFLLDYAANKYNISDISKPGTFGRMAFDEDAARLLKNDIETLADSISKPEVENVLSRLAALKNGKGLDDNTLSVEEYLKEYNECLTDLEALDDEIKIPIKTEFGIDKTPDELKKEIDDVRKQVKAILVNEDKEKVNELPINVLRSIHTNVTADENSLTLNDAKKAAEEAMMDWNKTVNVLDFSTMFSGIESVKDKINDITSAMGSLRDGTALTVEEMAKLAMKHPEMLKYSNLFADTSIKNQKAILDATLRSYESEHDAFIDAKISELQASKEILEKQITLEGKKKELVVKIADMQHNGELDSKRQYQSILNDLMDLEGKNYVKYSGGVLEVNKDMLEGQLAQEGDKVKESENIFEAQGNLIIEGHSKGLSGALKAFPEYAKGLATWAGTSFKKILSNIGTNIKKAFSGNLDFIPIFSGIDSLGNISVDGVDLETNIESNFTIDGQSLKDWKVKYENAINKRVETLQEEISNINIAIGNLKDIDFNSLYNTKSKNGGSVSKETEEYIVDFDAFYLALKRLESIQLRLNNLKHDMTNTNDLHEKIDLEQQYADILEEEIAAQNHLKGLRTETIKHNTDELRDLGFNVDYNEDTNEFAINNKEHVNELVTTDKGKYKDTTEATNELRKSVESLIAATEDCNSANQETEQTLQDLTDSVKTAKQNVLDYLDQIVEKANEVVDGFQDVYTTLTDAAKEYAETGYLSIDSLQSILNLGPKYLEYLYNENGQLQINEQALQRVLAAKTEEMAAETALTYAKQILIAVQEGEVDTLAELTQANINTSNATWGLAYATLGYARAMGEAKGMDSGYFDDALSNMQKMQAVTETSVKSISAYYKTLDSNYISQKDAIAKIIDLTKEMIKWETEQQKDALEKQKDDFADLIALRKEALEAAKKESDYDDDVEEKIRKIAKLQVRINTLSLDDSRDAQAQKLKLEEEMYELQKELSDMQADHAMETQTNALDKMQQAYEDSKDDEISDLESTLNSEEKLYQAAIQRIDADWDALYKDLLDWNYNYGSTLQSELVSAWDAAIAKAKEYSSFAEAEIKVNSHDTVGKYDSNTVDKGNNQYQNSYANAKRVRDIVAEMKRNSEEWRNPNADKEDLHNKNNTKAKELESYGLKVDYDDNTGKWIIIKDELDPGNNNSELYKKYHTGGIVGGYTNLKQNEVMAILEKGEAVLDRQKTEGLYTLVDFASILSEKLGKTISPLSAFTMPNIASQNIASLAQAIPNSVTNNQTDTIHFGDVYIYGANDGTIAKHREINRQFTNEVLKQLNIKK